MKKEYVQGIIRPQFFKCYIESFLLAQNKEWGDKRSGDLKAATNKVPDVLSGR